MPGGAGDDNVVGAIWVQGRGVSYSQGVCVWVLSFRAKRRRGKPGGCLLRK